MIMDERQASHGNVMPREAICQQAETYQSIVDEAVGERVDVEVFLERLRVAGALDYGHQYA
jgi:hypothetical protein